MALWGGRFTQAADQRFKQFNDSLRFDYRLAEQDIVGSVAWSKALVTVGVLTAEEQAQLEEALNVLLEDVRARPQQILESDAEDIHSWVESKLIDKVGQLGKKLHTGRSRNDQVATDLKLWCKDTVSELLTANRQLQSALVETAQNNQDAVMPGYTHLQRAQPVTFAHWCLAYVEMLARDESRLQDALKRLDVSPLGCGALAGTAYEIDREQLAGWLGFASATRNSLDSVSDRDHVLELLSAAAIGMVHLSRFAEDLIFFNTGEAGFVELSDRVTSGSSLMPQKKNPDALELIQMYCFIQPDFYHYCWSRSAQQSWERMDATFAQRGKLQFTLKQQGILVTDKSVLNKLDASTLIDLAMRYKKARKMSEAFAQASSGKRTKKAAAAINTVEGLLKEQEAFCSPVDESAFRLFTNTVRARYAAVCESIREMEEAKRAAFKKAMETSELRVPFSVQVGKGQSFTDAQLSMLTSLERQTGISLDFHIESLTRRQASLAISFLSAVRNMPSEIRNAVEFPDAKQVCLSAEKAEATAFVFRQVPKKKETV